MIGFESDEIQIKRLRERLRLITDEELIQLGKEVQGLCDNVRVSGTPDPWPTQLREAREEWRRRHPK
jgi:hypothetical protein